MPEKIKVYNSFFCVRGNSILAIRLIGLTKLDRISLLVPDLFKNKSLKALAIKLNALMYIDITIPTFN